MDCCPKTYLVRYNLKNWDTRKKYCIHLFVLHSHVQNIYLFQYKKSDLEIIEANVWLSTTDIVKNSTLHRNKQHSPMTTAMATGTPTLVDADNSSHPVNNRIPALGDAILHLALKNLWIRCHIRSVFWEHRTENNCKIAKLCHENISSVESCQVVLPKRLFVKKKKVFSQF